MLDKATQIVVQSGQRKNDSGALELYAWHAPEEVCILKRDTEIMPSTAYVDLGYRGGDADNPGIDIKHRGRAKSLTPQEWELLKRRQVIRTTGWTAIT